jgi:hypothetical protein
MIFFEKCGKQNSIAVFEIIGEYSKANHTDMIVICSTTGETASKALPYIMHSGARLVLCTQSLNDNYRLLDERKREMEKKYTIIEIPHHYLLSIAGDKCRKILRSFSQGTKVCIELMEYLQSTDLLDGMNEVIIAAGTYKGADTAISFVLNKNGYKIKEILAFPMA